MWWGAVGLCVCHFSQSPAAFALDLHQLEEEALTGLHVRNLYLKFSAWRGCWGRAATAPPQDNPETCGCRRLRRWRRGGTAPEAAPPFPPTGAPPPPRAAPRWFHPAPPQSRAVVAPRRTALPAFPTVPSLLRGGKRVTEQSLQEPSKTLTAAYFPPPLC